MIFEKEPWWQESFFKKEFEVDKPDFQGNKDLTKYEWSSQKKFIRPKFDSWYFIMQSNNSNSNRNDYNSVLHKIIIFAVDSNQTILSNSIH